MKRLRAWWPVAAAAALALLAGCGGHTHAHSSRFPRSIAEARLESRPIGAPARFHPQAPARAVPACRRSLGRRAAAHVELFASNRVVLVPAGIGTRGPWRVRGGRIVSAHCSGAVVTLEPTGLVLVRAGARATLADLFRQWGTGLSARGFAGFRNPGGRRVLTYVDGRRWQGSPAHVPLARHAEIVLEVGPRVPPHSAYAFPAGL